MRVIALGRTRMLWNTIKCLSVQGHEICLIATCKVAPEYEIGEDDFRALAIELGAEFIQTQNINHTQTVDKLKKAKAEVAISVNWINLIGPEVCGSFRHGILNAHTGDLPRYRGNAPVAWAILQNESRVGLTIHRMDPYELDAGPIFLKDYFPLTEHTYIGEVFAWLDQRVPKLFLDVVNGIESEELQPVPQPTDPQLALRCYPRRPEDGLIDWRWSALHLARLVRASAEPFAGAYSDYKGQKIVIWRAHAEKWTCPSLAVPGQVVWRNKQSGEVGIAAKDGILVIEEVELEGLGRGRPAKVIKSLRDRLGSGVWCE